MGKADIKRLGVVRDPPDKIGEIGWYAGDIRPAAKGLDGAEILVLPAVLHPGFAVLRAVNTGGIPAPVNFIIPRAAGAQLHCVDDVHLAKLHPLVDCPAEQDREIDGVTADENLRLHPVVRKAAEGAARREDHPVVRGVARRVLYDFALRVQVAEAHLLFLQRQRLCRFQAFQRAVQRGPELSVRVIREALAVKLYRLCPFARRFQHRAAAKQIRADRFPRPPLRGGDAAIRIVGEAARVQVGRVRPGPGRHQMPALFQRGLRQPRADPGPDLRQVGLRIVGDAHIQNFKRPLKIARIHLPLRLVGGLTQICGFQIGEQRLHRGGQIRFVLRAHAGEPGDAVEHISVFERGESAVQAVVVGSDGGRNAPDVPPKPVFLQQRGRVQAAVYKGKRFCTQRPLGKGRRRRAAFCVQPDRTRIQGTGRAVVPRIQ